MKIIALNRSEGKTTKLVEWVKQGEPVEYYPGWTRIILCIDFKEADRVRKTFDLDYTQVFSFNEWTRARLGLHKTIEVGIDDADEMLQSIIGRGTLEIITVNVSKEDK